MQSKRVLLPLSLGRATERHTTLPREWSKGQTGKLVPRVDTHKSGHLTKILGLLWPRQLPTLSLGLPGWGRHG